MHERVPLAVLLPLLAAERRRRGQVGGRRTQAQLRVELIVVERLQVCLRRQREHRAPVDSAAAAVLVTDARVRVRGGRGERGGAPRRRRKVPQVVLVGVQGLHAGRQPLLLRADRRQGRALRERGRRRVALRLRGWWWRGRAGALVALRLHFALYVPQRVANEHGTPQRWVRTLSIPATIIGCATHVNRLNNKQFFTWLIYTWTGSVRRVFSAGSTAHCTISFGRHSTSS